MASWCFFLLSGRAEIFIDEVKVGVLEGTIIHDGNRLPATLVFETYCDSLRPVLLFILGVTRLVTCLLLNQK